MAYKFQLGAFRASGSITVEDRFDVVGDAVLSGSIKLGDAKADEVIGNAGTYSYTNDTVFNIKDNDAAALDIKSTDGSSFMKFVTTNSSEVIVLGQEMSGAFAVKAQKFTGQSIGHRDDDDALQFEEQVVSTANDVDLHIKKVSGLKLADGQVTSTAAELNKLDGAGADVTAAKLTTLSALTDAEIAFLDGASAGSAVVSKAVVLSAAGDVAGIHDITGSSVALSESLVIAADGAGGSTGHLKLGAGQDLQLAVFSDHGVILNNTAEKDLKFQLKTAGGDQITPLVVQGSDHAVRINKLNLSGSAVTANATELNLLDDIPRGSIVYGNASAASARLAVGAANRVLASDGTDIAYSQVSNAMLAGSITAAKMNNAIFADLETLGAVDAADKFIVSTGAGAYGYETVTQVLTTLGLDATSDVTFEDGTFNGNVAIQGNLLVSGDTVTMNVENTEFADGIIGLGYASGSDDRTSGDRGIVMGLDSENDVAMIWDESASQFAFITTTQDANDVAINGDMTVTSYASLKVGALEATSFAGSVSKTIVSKNDSEIDNSGAGYQLSSGDTLILSADLGGTDRKVFLPASPAEGDVVEVKIKGTGAAGRFLQIKKGHANQDIDGGEAIVLESDYAAVTLIASSAGNTCKWRVF